MIVNGCAWVLTDALDSAIGSGDVSPFIVVMLFGENIANENRFDEVTYDAILIDFLDQMNERYRTNGQQAIGGISRGGFWAYHHRITFSLSDSLRLGGIAHFLMFIMHHPNIIL